MSHYETGQNALCGRYLKNRRTIKDATKPGTLGLLGHSDVVRLYIVKVESRVYWTVTVCLCLVEHIKESYPFMKKKILQPLVQSQITLEYGRIRHKVK